MSLGVSLHPVLMDNTAFHLDTLARLGLTRSFGDYQSQAFVSDLEGEACTQHAQSSYMGLEFIGMLKSMKDVFAEYSSFEELKRMRQAYIVHVLDVILNERSRVVANDRAIQQEEADQKAPVVGLDNVFKLAEQDENDSQESSDEEPEVKGTMATIAPTELVSVAKEQMATADRRD